MLQLYRHLFHNPEWFEKRLQNRVFFPTAAAVAFIQVSQEARRDHFQYLVIQMESLKKSLTIDLLSIPHLNSNSTKFCFQFILLCCMSPQAAASLSQMKTFHQE